MDAAVRAGVASTSQAFRQQGKGQEISRLLSASRARSLCVDGPQQHSACCACCHHRNCLQKNPCSNSFALSAPSLHRLCKPTSLLSNSASTDDYVSHNRKQQELKAPANRVAPAAREVARSYTSKVNGSSKTDVPHNGSVLAPDIAPCPPLERRAFTNFVATLATMILAVETQRRLEEAGRNTQFSIDSLRRGCLVDHDLVYRQQFVIRSYEVSYDRTASIETLTNLFQETALNHVGMSDFVGDGMGTTHAMMRHRLIWVVTRMHIQVDRYPVWGDVVEIDSWVCGAGKNGMRRDFLVRDFATGNILARATSTWVMMNQDTRRLSKMPDDVRAEISPYFLSRCILSDDSIQKIPKLDDSAPYIRSDLLPRLNDMDMNQHVNNVKYIGWVLESVPQSLLVAHELTSMILEYRRECSHTDVVQSMTCPESHSSSTSSQCGGTNGSLNASANASAKGSVNGHKSSSSPSRSSGAVLYTHLLRMQSDHTEIVRGRTVWRLKGRYIQ